MACPLRARASRTGALSGSREAKAPKGPAKAPSLLRSAVRGVVCMPHTPGLSGAFARCFCAHNLLYLSPQPCKRRHESIYQMKRQMWVLIACIPQGSLIPSLGLHPPSPSRGGGWGCPGWTLVSLNTWSWKALFPMAVPGCPFSLGEFCMPNMVRKENVHK